MSLRIKLLLTEIVDSLQETIALCEQYFDFMHPESDMQKHHSVLSNLDGRLQCGLGWFSGSTQYCANRV